MYVCIYVCMYVLRTCVCMYVCVCVFMYVCMFVCVCVYVYIYICMYYVCMYVCMYVGLYVCMYVWYKVTKFWLINFWMFYSSIKFHVIPSLLKASRNAWQNLSLHFALQHTGWEPLIYIIKLKLRLSYSTQKKSVRRTFSCISRLHY